VTNPPPVQRLELAPWRRFLRPRNRMRIGILGERTGIARWLSAALELVSVIPELSLEELFLLPPEPPSGSVQPWLFGKLFDWSRAGTDDLFEPVVPSLPAARRQDLAGAPGRTLSFDDRQRIADRRLDVLLCATPTPLTGDCAHLARWGVWSFSLGEMTFARYRPPFWREVYEKRDVSRIYLLLHDERLERGHVLEELATGTVSRLRFTLNQAAPLDAAAGILARTLLETAQRGTPPPAAASLTTGGPAPRWPTNFETTVLAARKLAQSAAYRLRVRESPLTWFVGIRQSSGPVDLANPGAGKPFREILPPPGHWYADPFIVDHDSRHWLFVEDWDQDTGRGCLACMEVRGAGITGELRVVLALPHHLSYPYVFPHQGEFFMIPESIAGRNVQLYRATRFPFEWKLESILLDNVELVDTSALLYDGTWYFFASTLNQPEEAYLFTASRLDGPWQYHTANPIVSDTRRLRGAGLIFSHEGRIIRPVQDCSLGYGYAVALSEIRRLTPTTYEDRQIAVMPPTWAQGLTGTHTFNFNSSYEVVDGLKPIRPRG
jgi:hypothetical protein